MPHQGDIQLSATIEKYWPIAIRQRWWIFLPLFLCWATVWGMSWLLKPSYQSEALILVEPQKLPDQYVVPNVTIDLQNRLQSITQQILSRTRLQGTIDRFHLYPPHHGLRGRFRSEDPVDQMRRDVKVELVKSAGNPGDLVAFKIDYSAASPLLAQQVNRELTSLFVDQHVKVQQQLSENTTAFLEGQVEDARAKMAVQEANLAAFKSRHLGELPTQLESNVQILAGLEAQLQSNQRGLDAAKQQKLYFESLLQQYQSVRASAGAGEATAPTVQELEKQQIEMRVRLEDFRSHYTDEHPDIIALKEKIARNEELKKQIEGDGTTSNQHTTLTTGGIDLASVEGVQHGTPTSIMQVQSQLKANELEIQNYQQHEKALESEIAEYRLRLNRIPETEQDLADISRGYEESKVNYNSLLQKQMQSQLATSLEREQQGEQFRIVDPPSLPYKPSAPKHFLVSLAGLILGIVVGVSSAGFVELTDLRIRLEKDLEGIIPGRVLVGIPRLSTPREDALRTKAQWRELGVAVPMIIFIVVANLYAFYKG